MCFIFVISCDNRPEFDDVKNNFYTNKTAFDELSSVTCKLGNKKQKFSSTIDRFGYSPRKIKEEFRNRKLDSLLLKVGGYTIIYKKTSTGKCSLLIGYHASGFAGNGVSYNYRFQIESITPYEIEKHTIEIITKAKQKTNFDMPLDSSWYFSFKYS
jgi:hypothetical protein